METELKHMSRLAASKKKMTVEEICATLHLSRRQVLYRLEKINQVLHERRIPPILAGSVLHLEPETRQALLELATGGAEIREYEYTPSQRQLILYLMLFTGLERLVIGTFMEALDVSRNTVLADLKQLRQSLEAEGIGLVSDRKKGYVLEGEEGTIRRRMILQVMEEIASHSDVQLFDQFLRRNGLGEFALTEAACLELASQQDLRFARDRMTEFIYIFLLLRARICRTGAWAPTRLPMADCPEKRFVHAFLEQTGSAGLLGDCEEAYLTSWILGISFGSVDEDTEDCLLIADITGRIMSRFEQLTGLDWPDPEDMFVRLYSHIRPAYYRLLYGIPILNPLTARVKAEYPHFYEIVSRAVVPAQELAGKVFPDDEIAYLTMHFAALCEGMHPAGQARRKKALILCLNGIGSSAILHSELTELFPQLEFETADHLKRKVSTRKPDIIFAARSLTRMPETDIPVVTVSPVMDAHEKFLVIREVNSLLGQDAGIPTVDMILDTIRRYCRVQKEEELRHALSAMFSATQPALPPAAGLLSMMDPRRIRTHGQARTVQEAVRLGYRPLLEAGIITESYVAHTIESLRLAGPYVVIAPGVALLHTASDKGALKPGIALTVLETPVEFQSSAHDPIRCLFALSVPEETPGHLEAMAALLRLLEDERFMEACIRQDGGLIWQCITTPAMAGQPEGIPEGFLPGED